LALRRAQGEEREDEEKAGDESGGGTSHGGRRGARRPQAGVDLCAQEGAPSGGAGAVSCLRACVRVCGVCGPAGPAGLNPPFAECPRSGTRQTIFLIFFNSLSSAT